MKKIFYSVFLMLAISCFRVHAQSSFTLQNLNNYLQGSSSTYLFEGSVDVINNSASAKDVIMFRKINNVASGHESYFCWGTYCYAPSKDSSDPEHMSPGSLLLACADLTTLADGLSTVTYCWFDANNPSDSICLEFIYDITTGINEAANANAEFLSLPHPNPADTKTTIFYHLKNHDAGSGIIFYNVIGSKILEVKSDGSKEELQLNTASFPGGVYFYSLISDSKVIGTNKLIVTHKN
ncbi:MAG TPA: T9SS type A sorting domain-containing protein [Bacteroidia bacterium]|nr:T9SS type A sorting domain-containing protein [Bacteroidia bacterium]